MTDIQAQAHAVLSTLLSTPFDQCYAITRNFVDLPSTPGIYAIRHRSEGLLYLGKTNRLIQRFDSGHKAFTWAWLDFYSPLDVRIAFAPIDPWKNLRLISELESILLRATEPPYNARIPMEN